MKRLFIDVETGGLRPSYDSLLSASLRVWINGNVVDKLDLFIKEDVYHCDPEAMAVNKINLAWLSTVGVAPAEAVLRIKHLTQQYWRNDRIVLGGQGTMFDRSFLERMYILAGFPAVFNDTYGHRVVDTASFAMGLQDAGKLPEDVDPSLRGLMTHFGFGTQDHTAANDIDNTILVYHKLLELVK